MIIIFAKVSRMQVNYSSTYERLFGSTDIHKAEDICTNVIIIFATVLSSKVSYSREIGVCLATQMIFKINRYIFRCIYNRNHYSTYAYKAAHHFFPGYERLFSYAGIYKAKGIFSGVLYKP